MDKTQEIREALNDVDLDAYEDYAFENVMHKSKARICANAPEWLSYLLTELDAAKQENERLRARLRPVFCNNCKGASPADDYVGMHLINEECPACNNAEKFELKQRLKQVEQENERLRQIRYNATEAHLNIQTGLVEQIETLQRRFKQVEEAIQVAYNIAYENFETVNQMDLIRLTLGDTLSLIRGEATKEENA